MPRRGRPKPAVDCQASMKALTIHDYANNANPSLRLRKAHLPRRQVDAHEQKKRAEADASAINDEHLEDAAEPAARPRRRRNRQGTAADSADPGHQYATYPDDVWHAIGRHVAAEDVGRFAAICSQSADVCRTASFWTHLYRREYDPKRKPPLPDRLQPECMVRIGGLRACTIRTLFHCNPVMRDRLRRSQQQPSLFELGRRECVGCWAVITDEATTAKGTAGWHCYRLRRRLPVGSRMARAEQLRRGNVFDRVARDIYQNADEACVLLAVRLAALRPLPQLLGHTSFVGEVRHNLSGRGCAEYRLELQFVAGSGLVGGGLSGRPEVLAQVVYDPVAEVRVLDWWSPGYHEFGEMAAVPAVES